MDLTRLEMLDVAGFAATSPEFKGRLVNVAWDLGLNPDHLATVISFESAKTFSPSVRAGGNPKGAVGLIQFTQTGIDWLNDKYGTDLTKDDLAAMSAVDQLEDWVRRWYAGILEDKGLDGLSSVGDHYLAVFAPAHVGKWPTQVLYASPSPEYLANANLDKDASGTVTIAETTAVMNSIQNAAWKRPRLVVELEREPPDTYEPEPEPEPEPVSPAEPKPGPSKPKAPSTGELLDVAFLLLPFAWILLSKEKKGR